MWKERFPGLAGKTYLATCSHGPLSRDVKDAIDSYLRSWTDYGNPWEQWAEVVDEASAFFSKLIGAKEAEVTPHYAASTALSTVVSCLNFKERNEIVITELDFPTTTVITLAQEVAGAKVRIIEKKSQAIALEDYKKEITKKTKLVLVIHVSSWNGFKQDIRAIAEIAHKQGALVFVDAYQSAGYTVIDAKKSDVDFLVAGTTKYLLGTPGCAFLYVRQDLIEDLKPKYTGWFSQTDPFEYGRTRLSFASSAYRFQSGTWSVPSIYAAKAGLKLVIDANIRATEEKVRKLTSYALARIREQNLEPVAKFDDQHRGAIVSVKLTDAHKLELDLRKRGVITSARGEGLRLSLHFFNDEQDVDSAIAAIKAAISK